MGISLCTSGRHSVIHSSEDLASQDLAGQIFQNGVHHAAAEAPRRAATPVPPCARVPFCGFFGSHLWLGFARNFQTVAARARGCAARKVVHAPLHPEARSRICVVLAPSWPLMMAAHSIIAHQRPESHSERAYAQRPAHAYIHTRGQLRARPRGSKL